MEEFAQHCRCIRIQLRVVERAVHQLHPSVAGGSSDCKRHVAHAQPRMPALFDVARRPAKAANQEIAEPDFGSRKVVGGIHRSEDVVARHLRIERVDKPGETLLADMRIDLVLCQIHNLSMSSDESPKTAYELAMERLRRKDAEEGVEERAVSEAQKAAIAEARRVHSSRIAETEILYKSKRMTAFEPEALMKLDEEHRRDLARLQSDLDKKLAKIRG